MQNPDAIEIEFNSSVVLEKNAKATTKIVANEGGSRSTKTYSIAQLLIGTGISSPYPIEITISRKRLTWLRDTAMKDFFDILTQYNLYFPRYHNKTTNSYQLYNGHFAFTGLDEPQKLRGRKQHIFWLNEANEATKEDFLQVELRTSQKIYLDYNPSDEYHWLYETVIPRPDCTLIKSTFLDNPYLDPELKKTILRLKEADLVIRPQVRHLTWADFDKTDEIIAAGEQTSKENINEIKKLIHRNSYLLEIEHYIKKLKGDA